MSELVLIRGVPGSGKTTMAKRMVADGLADVHFETDDWFTSGGVYRFDPAKLTQNHAKCQEATRAALAQGKTVVVSNTFTRRWEMDGYYAMGYPTREVVATGKWENTHGVPANKVQAMRDRFEV